MVQTYAVTDAFRVLATSKIQCEYLSSRWLSTGKQSVTQDACAADSELRRFGFLSRTNSYEQIDIFNNMNGNFKGSSSHHLQ